MPKMNNNMRIQIRLTQKDFVALTLKGDEKENKDHILCASYLEQHKYKYSK